MKWFYKLLGLNRHRKYQSNIVAGGSVAGRDITYVSSLKASSGMININGKVYSGNNVSISGNRVFIDGKEIEGEGEDKGRIIRVEIKGDPVSVTSDTSISVDGDVKGNVVAGSSVSCGNIGGAVDAGSSVSCGSIGGNVKAGS